VLTSHAAPPLNNSKIDDVRVTWPRTGLGPPILFTNIDIRRMLRLAKAGLRDVFYDLGCGWAQNLIIAATEFNVKKCVGVERDKRRYHKAVQRVRARNLSSKIRIIRGNFEDMIDGVLTDEDIKEATIVFYGLSTSPDFLERLSDKMRRNARLVYYYNTLFPEIRADAMDYPFYVSKHPFTRPVSEHDWLTSIIRKEKSSLGNGRKPTTEELWQELTHDYDYWGLRAEVGKYRTRLRSALRIVR
jgi:precorrin-6B methylase 2